MAQICNALTLSAEKGADYADKWRVDLIKGLEETGTPVIESNIEEQIAEFIPKHVRRGNDDAGSQT